jgi:WD40 repeat protein
MSIVFDPTKTHEVQVFEHNEQFLTSRFSPCGRYVFGSTPDRNVYRHDLDTGEKVTMTGHPTWVGAMAFQIEGKTMFTGDYWGRIHSWQYDQPQPHALKELDMAHDGILRDMALTTDGRTLLTCGRDKVARAWNTDDLSLIREFVGHKDDIYSLAISPDGQSLVTGDQLGIVKEWNIESGKHVRDIDASALLSDPYKNGFVDMGGVRRMAFDREGKRLACTGMVKGKSFTFSVGSLGILEFDWETGEQIRSMEPEGGGFMKGVLYLPNGTLVTAAEGPHGKPHGGLWFWKDGASTEPLFFLQKFFQIKEIDLHPDGLHLAAPHFHALGHGGNGKRPGDYTTNQGSVRVYRMTAKPEDKAKKK